jgi:hypothetical protein
MKKMLAGVMLGIVIGITVSAGIVHAGDAPTFVSVRLAETLPDSYVLGYVAGAYDMLVGGSAG